MNKSRIKKEIRWLLKEKYMWSENSINKFLLDFDLKSLKKNVKEDIDKIINGEDVIDYIIGFRRFLGCKIDLFHRPLIPREETEYWTKKVLGRLKERRVFVLDLCCGSGCIGVTVLRHNSKAKVLFADNSDSAIKQTLLNLRINGIEKSRYELVKSDLFSNLGAKKFDFILCNPPYVDKNGCHQKSLVYEPAEAIFAEEGGLFVIKRVLSDFPDFLLDTGSLFLEFGYGHKNYLENTLSTQHSSLSWEFHNDQFGKPRFLEVREHQP